MTFFTADDLVTPGTLVTQTGQSQKKVAWPDASDDALTGVVGCLPGQDVDTAYPIGSTVPVYMIGSFATVWVRFRASGGALVAGSPVTSDDTGPDGQGILAVDGGDIFAAGVGRCTHWHDDIASQSWVAVKLRGV